MMTIDTIFVDNQGWGGARSSRVSASSPLFPCSIVWWAPFVFHLFYEVWHCSSYCLYPWINFLSDPCPIIVLQFVQSPSQSDSICFPKQLKVCKNTKVETWSEEWGETEVWTKVVSWKHSIKLNYSMPVSVVSVAMFSQGITSGWHHTG